MDGRGGQLMDECGVDQYSYELYAVFYDCRVIIFSFPIVQLRVNVCAVLTSPHLVSH